jgi:hypothetical protein
MAAHCCAAPTPEKQQDTSLMATVNGEAIMLREFMLHARALRPLVISEYRTRYGAEYSGEFWSRKFDGVTPMETLKSRTLDSLVYIKVQQISGRQAGITGDISYQGFLKELETENRRRLVAKQSGKVIYGPVQYSEEVYYNYLFSNMVNRLKEFLAASVFRITEEDLKEAYEKEKDSLYRMGYYTGVNLIKLKTGDGTSGDNGKNMARETETILVFNDSLYAPEEDDPIRSMAKETARKLIKGQSSQVVELNGAFYIVEVTEKAPLGYRSFTSCRTVVRILLLDRMYDQYIHDLANRAKRRINMEVYPKISF